MKVFYDHKAFTMERYGGVSRYFCELMQDNRFEHSIGIAVNTNANLHEYGYYNQLLNYNSSTEDINNDYSNVALTSHEYDIVHSTFFETDVIKRCYKPLVVTVHDLIPEVFDWDTKERRDRKVILDRADAIIAISMNTASDIIKYYGTQLAGKIKVIYHGTTQLPYQIMSLDRPYLLYVGQREMYKGWKQLVESIAPLLIESDIDLICTGPRFNDEELKWIESNGVARRVHHNKSSLNADLGTLYHNADALLYPSYYEGFGLPILEAWSVGCPVFARKCSCIPEVMGDSDFLFYDNDDLVLRLRDYLNRGNSREELYIKERVKEFTWRNTRDKTYEVYKSLL